MVGHFLALFGLSSQLELLAAEQAPHPAAGPAQAADE